MVARCPCKQKRCACIINGDNGIEMSGNGTNRLPYIPKFTQWSLVAGDTSQADVTITGNGTSGSPWVVTIDTLGGSIQQTIYTSDDTWDKPAGGTVAEVVVIGGGGGGGASATGRPGGGSGGDGGAMSVAWFPLADLPDEVEIKVGQGGAGAQPISGLTTGGKGGDSWYGEYLYAPGGLGGHSQANASQTQTTTDGGTPPSGGPGGGGAVRDGLSVVPATAHDTYLSPTGGGMGAGTDIAASAGGALFAENGWAGGGGDGGAGPFPGSDGGLYGGGGGGGASPDDFSQSSGGDGGSGVVVVTVW